MTSSWEQLASSICEQHRCESIDSIDSNKKFHDHDDHSQEVGSGVVGALAASVTEPLPGALHAKTALHARYTSL